MRRATAVRIAAAATALAGVLFAVSADASAPRTQLSVGATLGSGATIASPSGQYRAVMQGDGNFVVYGPHGATFSTHTFVRGAAMVMQGDGNLVIYADGHARYATHTAGSNAVFKMQNDGNAVIYSGGKALWSSKYGAPMHVIFNENFSTPAALGTFASSVYGSKFWTYSGPDTSGVGTYDTSKVVSVHDGYLDMFLHTAGGQALSAAIVPDVSQQYGRYSVRFRADSMAGYGAAFLLWPDSNVWNDGEIDFPEGNFDSTMAIHDHCVGNAANSCYNVDTGVTWTAWHTATTEWTPGRVTFSIDGNVVGSSSVSPTAKMHMVMQTGTDGTRPAASVSGHVQIDWISIWDRS